MAVDEEQTRNPPSSEDESPSSDSQKKPKRKKGGNRITRKLLRKRSEHNECIISTLEEVSLHQEELSAIDPILGMSCRNLKILLLQNNIISKIENMHHLKDVEYVNLALNNISRIENLDKCEFLRKLDLTVNFIDLDTLEDSVEHLKPREHLRELWLMGNPCGQWDGLFSYVVHSLPRLTNFDGTEIVRSHRLVAKRQFPHLCLELRDLATKVVKTTVSPEDVDAEEATPYVPEVRTAMYEEMAEQKDEAAARKSDMAPRERDYDQEHREAVAREKAKFEVQESKITSSSKENEDAEEKVMQCNQGKWDFFFDEDLKPDHLALQVNIARHLDSSLIDLDVHPRHVSVVIKSKTLRLRLPCEVASDKAFAQRSKANGALVVFMPKIGHQGTVPLFSKKFYREHVLGDKRDEDQRQEEAAIQSLRGRGGPTTTTTTKDNRPVRVCRSHVVQDNGELRPRVTRKIKPPSVGTMLLAEAADDTDDDEGASSSSSSS